MKKAFAIILIFSLILSFILVTTGCSKKQVETSVAPADEISSDITAIGKDIENISTDADTAELDEVDNQLNTEI